jgi:hypothetical protein
VLEKLQALRGFGAFQMWGRRDFVLRATKSLLIDSPAIHRANWRSQFSLARKCSECIFEFFNRIDPKRSIDLPESRRSTPQKQTVNAAAQRQRIDAIPAFRRTGLFTELKCDPGACAGMCERFRASENITGFQTGDCIVLNISYVPVSCAFGPGLA